jgi:hypothetical protein
MEDHDIRTALDRHWAASDANDFDAEHQIYREDAVLEYPQSGERIRGRRNIQASRFAQPSRKLFTVRRILGAADLWITKLIITYDAQPSYTVSIMELAVVRRQVSRWWRGRRYTTMIYRAHGRSRSRPTQASRRAPARRYGYTCSIQLDGKPVWQGVVHVFDLTGHPTALRAMRGHRRSRGARDAGSSCYIPSGSVRR